jgi:two-component system, response regulator YesN
VTRILVVDDERPVVEAIAHIVRRELADEFEVAGTASSGREAVERAMLLSPDLVLMDVRMPGLSGLDAVRELRRRGSGAGVILITAYERFDIAREAVELGVLEYLLKPVGKEALARALRGAALVIERKGELERREIEHREKEEGMRVFAEAAFVQALMLGERSPAAIGRYAAALGIVEPLILAAAAAALPPPGARDPEGEAAAAYESLRATLRYKTRAISGPSAAGMIGILLPVRDAREGAQAAAGLRAAIEAAHSAELARGRLRLGLGSARPLAEAGAAWDEAVAALLGREAGEGAAPSLGGPESGALRLEAESFDDDEAFLAALAAPDPARAALYLESLLSPLGGAGPVPAAARHRIASLFGQALRELRRREALSGPEAAAALDLGDLASAPSGAALCLAARSRLASLSAAAARVPRRATPLDAAIDRIKEGYGRPITLDLVADELGVSPARLSRLFVEGTGKGFSDFLIEYRIERAKGMLLEPDAAIKQVSAACGYPDPNYFSRLFKKVTGMTPSAFSTDAMEANDEN